MSWGAPTALEDELTCQPCSCDRPGERWQDHQTWCAWFSQETRMFMRRLMEHPPAELPHPP